MGVSLEDIVGYMDFIAQVVGWENPDPTTKWKQL
jgi:hypothetical protein